MVEILVPDLHMTYNIYKTNKIDIISYAWFTFFNNKKDKNCRCHYTGYNNQ